MKFEIDFKPDKPLYLQIADYIKTRVALGELRPGERLPAIRELAKKPKLDPGTVARAYRELEREGIITGRRGSGSFVSLLPEDHLIKQRQGKLTQVMEKAIIEALGLGFTTEDIEIAFSLQLAAWREQRLLLGKKRLPPASKSHSEIRFLGSHDLAIELLASHLRTLYSDMKFRTSFVGSLAGLVALECGEADIAGAHLFDEESGQFNIPFIKKIMPYENVILMNLMQRIQGLMVAPRNPKHILGIEDLRRPEITFVNRQKGAGTRLLFDSRLLKLGIKSSEVKGYEQEEKTHVAIASAIAQGKADVGLGAQSAASAAGLDFIPLFKERYDLIALQENFKLQPFQKIKETVCSKSFRNMLRSIPGYDVSETSHILIIKPAIKSFAKVTNTR